MMRKILGSVIMLLVVASASSASLEAAPAYSWNLSRDMMSGITTNPFGSGTVWTAMYDSGGTSHNAVNYVKMPNYTTSIPNLGGNPIHGWYYPQALSVPHVSVATQTCNVNTSSNFIVVHGIPFIHPGPSFSSIVSWKSPINGNVNIMGRITDVDPAGGNGIKWFVDKGNFTLMSGILANGNNGATILQQNIPVSVGTCLYFIVSPNNDYYCDSTYLDIIITSP